MKKHVEWYEFNNNTYLKLLFREEKTGHNTIAWKVEAVIAKSKRKCNDCFNKSTNSQKKLWGRNDRNNLEVLRVATKAILNYEKKLPKGKEIFICAYDEKRLRAYKWFTRYGYELVENNFKIKNLNQCYRKIIKY